VLCPDGHQDLLGRREHPAPFQQARLDLLDQQLIVAIDQVAGPAADLGCRCRLNAAFPPAGNRQLRRIALAIEERIRIALPVPRLGDVAL
jgi:hypothetical protein